ncbi:MAG: HmuY family protein [Candidatus Amulumruptor caecigallinarius]|nr:HmuY family protein [Candidatus Amulumruptor caecigallinarius]
MMRIFRLTYVIVLILSAALLQSCEGGFGFVYDNPPDDETNTVAGKLFVDASDWGKWYYMDLQALARSVEANPDTNGNDLWVATDIPMSEIPNPEGKAGIYTYWYDVFGQGISRYEFVSYFPTLPQSEPQKWTFAVHRNNVRTNGCTVAATEFHDIDELPANRDYLASLQFRGDNWNETDVWCVQDKMLAGYIGNQGIYVNPVLSSWLAVSIPPIPPAFDINTQVFVIHLPDDTYGALQLENYQSATGVKCCLTINYRYPL